MIFLLDRLVPVQLGGGFRRLLAASWLTNLGDGIAAAAGPLLVASLTDDPFPVALAALLRWAPVLLFGLYAGALADRHDRRRIVLAANLSRVVLVSALAAAAFAGVLSVTLVLVVLGLLATAEVFADNTTTTLTPMLVHRDDLAVANARVQAGFITLNQMAGPAVGAVLFGLGYAWPFAGQALLLVAAVLTLWRVTLPPHGQEERAGVWREIAEGMRWLWGHAAVRTLAVTILVFNVTYGAAWAVLVLYATDHLDLGPIGFGLISAVTAAGGLAGIGMYGWLTRRISLAGLMRIGLIIETVTHLALALTSSPWIAMPVFFVFGAHAFVWGTTSVTIRQRAVPAALQGRVGSVYGLCVFGGLAVGAAFGGVLASVWGVTAPFWFAFAGSAVLVVLIWRQLASIAHSEPEN